MAKQQKLDTKATTTTTPQASVSTMNTKQAQIGTGTTSTEDTQAKLGTVKSSSTTTSSVATKKVRTIRDDDPRIAEKVQQYKNLVDILANEKYTGEYSDETIAFLINNEKSGGSGIVQEFNPTKEEINTYRENLLNNFINKYKNDIDTIKSDLLEQDRIKEYGLTEEEQILKALDKSMARIPGVGGSTGFKVTNINDHPSYHWVDTAIHANDPATMLTMVGGYAATRLEADTAVIGEGGWTSGFDVVRDYIKAHPLTEKTWNNLAGLDKVKWLNDIWNLQMEAMGGRSQTGPGIGKTDAASTPPADPDAPAHPDASKTKDNKGTPVWFNGVVVAYEAPAGPAGGKTYMVTEWDSKGNPVVSSLTPVGAVGLASLTQSARDNAAIAGGYGGLLAKDVARINAVRKSDESLAGKALADAIYTAAVAKIGSKDSAEVDEGQAQMTLAAQLGSAKAQASLQGVPKTDTEMTEAKRIAKAEKEKQSAYVLLEKGNPKVLANNEIVVSLLVDGRIKDSAGKIITLEDTVKMGAFNNALGTATQIGENLGYDKDTGEKVGFTGKVWGTPIGDLADVTAPGFIMTIYTPTGEKHVFRQVSSLDPLGRLMAWDSESKGVSLNTISWLKSDKNYANNFDKASDYVDQNGLENAWQVIKDSVDVNGYAKSGNALGLTGHVMITEMSDYIAPQSGLLTWGEFISKYPDLGYRYEKEVLNSAQLKSITEIKKKADELELAKRHGEKLTTDDEMVLALVNKYKLLSGEIDYKGLYTEYIPIMQSKLAATAKAEAQAALEALVAKANAVKLTAQDADILKQKAQQKGIGKNSEAALRVMAVYNKHVLTSKDNKEHADEFAVALSADINNNLTVYQKGFPEYFGTGAKYAVPAAGASTSTSVSIEKSKVDAEKLLKPIIEGIKDRYIYGLVQITPWEQFVLDQKVIYIDNVVKPDYAAMQAALLAKMASSDKPEGTPATLAKLEVTETTFEPKSVQPPLGGGNFFEKLFKSAKTEDEIGKVNIALNRSRIESDNPIAQTLYNIWSIASQGRIGEVVKGEKFVFPPAPRSYDPADTFDKNDPSIVWRELYAKYNIPVEVQEMIYKDGLALKENKEIKGVNQLGRYVDISKNIELSDLEAAKADIVLHELGHFLYRNYLTENQRQDFIEKVQDLDQFTYIAINVRSNPAYALALEKYSGKDLENVVTGMVANEVYASLLGGERPYGFDINLDKDKGVISDLNKYLPQQIIEQKSKKQAVTINIDDLQPIIAAGVTSELFNVKSPQQIIVESSMKKGKSEEIGGPDELKGQEVFIFGANTLPDLGSGRAKVPVATQYAITKDEKGAITGVWTKLGNEGWKSADNIYYKPGTKEVGQFGCTGVYCGNMSTDLKDGIKYLLSKNWDVGTAGITPPSLPPAQTKPSDEKPVVITPSENITTPSPYIKPKDATEFNKWKEEFGKAVEVGKIKIPEGGIFAGKDTNGETHIIGADKYENFNTELKKVFDSGGIAAIWEATIKSVNELEPYSTTTTVRVKPTVDWDLTPYESIDAKTNKVSYNIEKYAITERNKGKPYSEIKAVLVGANFSDDAINKALHLIPTDDYVTDSQLAQMSATERATYLLNHGDDPRFQGSGALVTPVYLPKVIDERTAAQKAQFASSVSYVEAIQLKDINTDSKLNYGQKQELIGGKLKEGMGQSIEKIRTDIAPAWDAENMPQLTTAIKVMTNPMSLSTDLVDVTLALIFSRDGTQIAKNNIKMYDTATKKITEFGSPEQLTEILEKYYGWRGDVEKAVGIKTSKDIDNIRKQIDTRNAMLTSEIWEIIKSVGATIPITLLKMRENLSLGQMGEVAADVANLTSGVVTFLPFKASEWAGQLGRGEWGKALGSIEGVGLTTVVTPAHLFKGGAKGVVRVGDMVFRNGEIFASNALRQGGSGLAFIDVPKAYYKFINELDRIYADKGTVERIQRIKDPIEQENQYRALLTEESRAVWDAGKQLVEQAYEHYDIPSAWKGDKVDLSLVKEMPQQAYEPVRETLRRNSDKGYVKGSFADISQISNAIVKALLQDEIRNQFKLAGDIDYVAKTAEDAERIANELLNDINGSIKSQSKEPVKIIDTKLNMNNADISVRLNYNPSTKGFKLGNNDLHVTLFKDIEKTSNLAKALNDNMVNMPQIILDGNLYDAVSGNRNTQILKIKNQAELNDWVNKVRRDAGLPDSDRLLHLTISSNENLGRRSGIADIDNAQITNLGDVNTLSSVYGDIAYLTGSNGNFKINIKGSSHKGGLIQVHTEGKVGVRKPFGWEEKFTLVEVDGIKMTAFKDQLLRRMEIMLNPTYDELAGTFGQRTETATTGEKTPMQPHRELKDWYRLNAQVQMVIDDLRSKGKIDIADSLQEKLDIFSQGQKTTYAGGGTKGEVIKIQGDAVTLTPQARQDLLDVFHTLREVAVNEGIDSYFMTPEGTIMRITSPSEKILHNTLFHVTDDIRPYQRLIKDGKSLIPGYVLDENGVMIPAQSKQSKQSKQLFLSPQEASAYLEANKSPHGGIVAIRATAIDRAKYFDPVFRTESFPEAGLVQVDLFGTKINIGGTKQVDKIFDEYVWGQEPSAGGAKLSELIPESYNDVVKKIQEGRATTEDIKQAFNEYYKKDLGREATPEELELNLNGFIDSELKDNYAVLPDGKIVSLNAENRAMPLGEKYSIRHDLDTYPMVWFAMEDALSKGLGIPDVNTVKAINRLAMKQALMNAFYPKLNKSIQVVFDPLATGKGGSPIEFGKESWQYKNLTTDEIGNVIKVETDKLNQNAISKLNDEIKGILDKGGEVATDFKNMTDSALKSGSNIIRQQIENRDKVLHDITISQLEKTISELDNVITQNKGTGLETKLVDIQNSLKSKLDAIKIDVNADASDVVDALKSVQEQVFAIKGEQLKAAAKQGIDNINSSIEKNILKFDDIKNIGDQSVYVFPEKAGELVDISDYYNLVENNKRGTVLNQIRQGLTDESRQVWDAHFQLVEGLYKESRKIPVHDAETINMRDVFTGRFSPQVETKLKNVLQKFKDNYYLGGSYADYLQMTGIKMPDFMKPKDVDIHFWEDSDKSTHDMVREISEALIDEGDTGATEVLPNATVTYVYGSDGNVRFSAHEYPNGNAAIYDYRFNPDGETLFDLSDDGIFNRNEMLLKDWAGQKRWKSIDGIVLTDIRNQILDRGTILLMPMPKLIQAGEGVVEIIDTSGTFGRATKTATEGELASIKYPRKLKDWNRFEYQANYFIDEIGKTDKELAKALGDRLKIAKEGVKTTFAEGGTKGGLMEEIGNFLRDLTGDEKGSMELPKLLAEEAKKSKSKINEDYLINLADLSRIYYKSLEGTPTSSMSNAVIPLPNARTSDDIRSSLIIPTQTMTSTQMIESSIPTTTVITTPVITTVPTTVTGTIPVTVPTTSTAPATTPVTKPVTTPVTTTTTTTITTGGTPTEPTRKEPPRLPVEKRTWDSVSPEDKLAAIVWKQGFWNYALVPPFTQDDLIGSSHPFAGTFVHHGPLAAYKSVAKVKGDLLPEKIQINLGTQDLEFIKDKNGKDVVVRYKLDPDYYGAKRGYTKDKIKAGKKSNIKPSISTMG
jgi:hypothetical protein